MGGGRFRALIGGVSAGYGSDGGHQAVYSADRRETIRCGGLTSMQDHDVSWVSHADQPAYVQVVSIGRRLRERMPKSTGTSDS